MCLYRLHRHHADRFVFCNKRHADYGLSWRAYHAGFKRQLLDLVVPVANVDRLAITYHPACDPHAVHPGAEWRQRLACFYENIESELAAVLVVQSDVEGIGVKH